MEPKKVNASDISKKSNEDESDEVDKNEDDVETENIFFLRVLTASLCEVLVSKYGHDILDGKIW